MSRQSRHTLLGWPTASDGYANPPKRVFIGTSGYSYPDWKSVVYPRSLKRDVGGPTPELTYLSRYFNTCEINATFYRQFEPEIAKRWSEAVENPCFEFAIKASQAFTHAAGTSPSDVRACWSRNLQ